MKHILVIDDNRELLDINAAWLSKLSGVLVESTSDSAGARELLKSKRYDLVISDFRMPRFTGLDLVHTLRQSAHGLDVPVIILTGYAVQLRAKHSELKNVHMVEKPAPRQDLTELVMSLLEDTYTVASGTLDTHSLAS